MAKPFAISNRLSAALLAVTAVLCFSSIDALGKLVISQGADPMFASMMRYLVQGVLVAIIFRAWAHPLQFLPGHGRFLLQALRGALLVGSGALVFLAVRTLHLAELVSIIFLAPMMITLMARLFLGERVEWQRYAAILAGFSGVLIIVRPGFQSIDPGHVFAFFATATYSGFSILTRLMGPNQTQESLMVMPSLVALVAMAPPVLMLSPVPALPVHWALMLIMGTLGTVGQLLLLSAYRLANASDVAPYIYAQMFWAVLLGWLVFAEIPDRWTLAGSAVIVASGLYIVLRDRRIAETEAAARAS